MVLATLAGGRSDAFKDRGKGSTSSADHRLDGFGLRWYLCRKPIAVAAYPIVARVAGSLANSFAGRVSSAVLLISLSFTARRIDVHAPRHSL